MSSNYKYITATTPRLKNIDTNFILECENKLHNIISNSSMEGLTDIEIKALLDYVINKAREILATVFNIDIVNDPLTNKCDLMQAMVGYALEKMGADVKIIETQKTISSEVEGHSFLIVGFPSQNNGNVVEKFYLVDPTYRQFFLNENCSDSKYLIKDKMILIAPHPGYYYLYNKEMMPIAEKIISDGYIELTSDSAKAYGDSFYVTHRGYKNNFDQDRKTTIMGDIYTKAFLKGKSKYSISEEDLSKNGLQIITPIEEQNKSCINI